MLRIAKNAFINVTAAMMVGGVFLLPFAARAATVSGFSDALTRHQASVSSDHTILFVTPTGIDAPTDTITINFASTASPTFTMGSVSFDDVDLAIDTTGDTTDCSGPFTDKTLAATPAAGVWGAIVGSNILTLTPPTDAALGEVPAGDCLQIQIGSNAGGADQITNPSASGAYSLGVAGNFGDTGQAYLPINNADQVTVTATVESSGGGGVEPPPPPTPPNISSVQVINITETTASVTWNTDVGSDSTVEYGKTIAYGSTASVGGSVFGHNVPLSDLVPGTLYHFRVKSLGAGGLSTSGDYTFTTLDTTPPVISNVQVVNTTGTTATIMWDTDEDATSRVDYGIAEPYCCNKESLTLTNSHSIDLTGLTPNTTYRFRVRSTDASGNSAGSVEFTLLTADTVPPTISGIDVIDITVSTATVKWATNELADSKVVYGPEISYGSQALNASLVANHTIDLTLLSPATLYHFAVVSRDTAGNSATSTDQTFTTLSDTTPPANVSGFTATPGDQEVVLTWVNPTDTDFAGVLIKRKTGSSPTGPADGTTVFDAIGTSVTDTGLTNGIKYYYAAFAVDTSGNFATGALANATPVDGIPPNPVSGLTIAPGDGQNFLSWTNATNPDVAGVRIQRSTTGFPADPTSGTNVFLGSGTSYFDFGLTNGTTYYYSVFTLDTSGNVSVPAKISGTPMEVAICGNAICEAIETYASCPIDCPLIPVCGDATCQPPETNASCPVDCLPPAVCGDAMCQPPETSASCPIDCPLVPVCGDATCQPPETNVSCPVDCPLIPVCGDATCQPPETSASCPVDCPFIAVCGNAVCEAPENAISCPVDCIAEEPDAAVCGDGPCSPGETNQTCPMDCPLEPTEPDELIEIPEETIEPEDAMDVYKIKYYTYGRTLEVFPDEFGEIHVMQDVIFSVIIPADAFKKEVGSMILNFGKFSYMFQETLTKESFVVDIRVTDPDAVARGVVPDDEAMAEAIRALLGVPTAHAAETLFTIKTALVVYYTDNTVEVTTPALNVEDFGLIFMTKGDTDIPIPGATITLQEMIGGSWMTWSGAEFKQTNPVLSDETGAYGFMTPPGEYRVVVEKEGYRTRYPAPVFITRQISNINVAIEMVRLPKKFSEVIVPGATIIENIINVTRAISEQSVYITKVIRIEVIEDPRVIAVTSNYIVPAAAIMTTIVVASSVQALSFLTYLYFLLTQPFLLIARRKRKEFGVVFNALSKMPVDLAIIRLFRKDGKLVRTIATDKQGRYAFLADPGEYRIEASKPKFNFPTEFMKGIKEGTKYLDLYHGEIIVVGEEGAVIAANIPMDPIETVKSGNRLMADAVLRKLQDFLGLLSVIISGVACALYRFPWLFFVFAFQVAMYFIFRRLSRPKRPKNWGIVYDKDTKKPVPYAVTRIVETAYNKVLESRVTDRRGRYNFLVGNNTYFVSVEKPGYEKTKTRSIDLTRAEGGGAVIAKDISIKKTSDEILKDAAVKGMTPEEIQAYEAKWSLVPRPESSSKMPRTKAPPHEIRKKMGTDGSDENEMKRLYMEKTQGVAQKEPDEKKTDVETPDDKAQNDESSRKAEI